MITQDVQHQSIVYPESDGEPVGETDNHRRLMFDLIFALTQGGPLDSSNVLPLLSYQFSFQQFKFGIGAAVGTFAVVFVFAVALVYVRTLKHEVRA